MRLLADENLSNDLLRALRQLRPDIDIVRVQDVGLAGAEDAVVLEWAASQGRLVVAHDLQTMPDSAYERASAGKAMPGVLIVQQNPPYGIPAADIAWFHDLSFEGECEGRVAFLRDVV